MTEYKVKMTKYYGEIEHTVFATGYALLEEKPLGSDYVKMYVFLDEKGQMVRAFTAEFVKEIIHVVR